MRIIASFTKFGDISEADFGDLAGPLVCRNDTYAHYEIKVNKPLYEGIRTKRLYDREVLDHLTAPVSFENGSVEIKAAWREFTDDEGEEVRSRYYRVHASLKRYDTGQCEDRELGLIGLHIVQKTPLRPQWVWSTFEHVDNVPAFGQTPSLGASFSLNDPKGPLNLDPVDPPLQVTDATYLDPAGHPVLPPMQVIRQRPIAGATADTNARYQNALRGTVWANYMLVMTQWPTKTTQPSGAPFPTTGFGTAITNTTMETYFQSSTSCMGCHDLSRHSNMDFVFFPMIHAARQDPGPENSTTQLFMDKLKINFAQFRQESITARQQLLGSDR
jgi:hypothetical protein